MAKTTTIRIDSETHDRLLELSRERGTSLGATVREAAEALRRDGLARRVAQELTALRADPDQWADYLAEADSTAVADGIG